MDNNIFWDKYYKDKREEEVMGVGAIIAPTPGVGWQSIFLVET